MRAQVTLVLGHDLRLGFLAAQAMAQRGLHDGFLQYGAVIKGDGEGVGNRACSRVVVGGGEEGIFDAGDAPAERLDKWGGGGRGAVGVVTCGKAVVHQHGGDHVLYNERVIREVIVTSLGLNGGTRGKYLDAVVAVGEIVHWFVLFVDNANTSLVGANSDRFDILRGFLPLL